MQEKPGRNLQLCLRVGIFVSRMKKAAKIARLLLVATYLFYFASTSLFIHTHIFSWGRVTHSHPYLPSDKGHAHSQSEIDFIAYLSSSVPLAQSLVSAMGAFLLLLSVFVVSQQRIAVGVRFSAVRLRAPPAVVCL